MSAASGRFAVAMLATSLVFVEFLAGMQRSLSQTVLPLVAADLEGAHLYGPLDAAAQAPMFLMMPLGAWLLSRYRVGLLMMVFTVVTITGAAVCALAPSMWWFIAGTGVRAVAGGALATVSMGALSRGLPARSRQLVLAAMSGVWLFSSVLGPVYAVAATSAFGWRWAMVLYLPLLLVARMLVAHAMPERTDAVPPQKAPWGWSLVLAGGAAVLALPIGLWSAAALATGTALVLVAARAVLPAGVLGAKSGRRAALSALAATAAVYFGASMVLSVVSHDAFGLGPDRFGFVIAAPGLLWAVAALWTGSRPALTDDAFGRRALPAGATIALAVLVLLATTLTADDPSTAFAGLLLGAGMLGLGMGSLYPDLLGRCLTPPAALDGIGEDQMATSVVIAESVGMTLATTTAFAWLGSGLGLVDDPVQRARLLYLGLLPLAALMLERLAAASRVGDSQLPRT